jgi:hypothetical protein
MGAFDSIKSKYDSQGSRIGIMKRVETDAAIERWAHQTNQEGNIEPIEDSESVLEVDPEDIPDYHDGALDIEDYYNLVPRKPSPDYGMSNIGLR